MNSLIEIHKMLLDIKAETGIECELTFEADQTGIMFYIETIPEYRFDTKCIYKFVIPKSDLEQLNVSGDYLLKIHFKQFAKMLGQI